MPKNEEKLSLDDLELTTEEAEQVIGGASFINATSITRQPVRDLSLVFGPRPDQSLVFGPRPDQSPALGTITTPAVTDIATIDFANIFSR